MHLDIQLREGRRSKPAVIFIHGLGMDKDIWVNPLKSRILGGKFPLTTLLSKKPDPMACTQTGRKNARYRQKFTLGDTPVRMQTLFDDFRKENYPVITWSQQKPAAPIDRSVEELRRIVRLAQTLTDNGIVLVGHSRGGLIGRTYSEQNDPSIKSLVTIATPHHGSSVAMIAKYISPFVTLISPFFPEKEKGTFSFAVRRTIEFLKSEALEEILPQSGYYSTLHDNPISGVSYMTIGGTDPVLFSVYRWREAEGKGKSSAPLLIPDELFSIPFIFKKIIPMKIYPEELKKGLGDGLVSVFSSALPWEHEHYTFELNHAEILFDKVVRDTVLKSVKRMIREC